jgi:hypothetical protein
VQVTVSFGPRRHPFQHLVSSVSAVARSRLLLALALAAAAAGLFVGSAGGGREARPTAAPSVKAAHAAQLHDPGPAGVAAAFRYPLGCLSVTIYSSHPAYATALLDRASPCWRYGVYVTAIFRRADGQWRLMLEADSNSCPAVALPSTVRAQLARCVKPVPGAIRR